MKVLMVRPGPNFSVADVYRGWYRGLVDLGCRVVDLNYDERLSFYSTTVRRTPGGPTEPVLAAEDAIRLASKGIEAACFEFWPDVLLVVSGFYVPLDVLDCARARGIAVVLLHTESPYEDERQLARAAHADLNILNDPSNLARFNQVAPTIYLPHAYDPAFHHPGPVPDPDCESDFCFVGTGYPSRVVFFEQVCWDGIDVALGGNWQGLSALSPLRKMVAHRIEHCLENTAAVELYRGAKASANLYRREAEADRADLTEGWAMGPREVELAATGCFYLTEARGENREVLPMVPTFDSPADFETQLRWYLDHDDARTRVADAARAAVADRTFVNNARHLLAALEQRTATVA